MIEFNCSLELLFRTLPVPFETELDHRQRQMRFRNGVVDTQALRAASFALGITSDGALRPYSPVPIKNRQ